MLLLLLLLLLRDVRANRHQLAIDVHEHVRRLLLLALSYNGDAAVHGRRQLLRDGHGHEVVLLLLLRLLLRAQVVRGQGRGVLLLMLLVQRRLQRELLCSRQLLRGRAADGRACANPHARLALRMHAVGHEAAPCVAQLGQGVALRLQRRRPHRAKHLCRA
jgi:hypothetical protein